MNDICKLKEISLFLFAVLILSGCSQQLLNKNDYRKSLNFHYLGKPSQAIKNFPEKEDNSFITVMEKTYLNLIQGKADIIDLKKQAKFKEDRIRFKATREIKSLFYVKTREGYYASEHEVIWMHMLLSWGYSLQNQYNKACVEARKSSHLLTAPWSHEGHFDDPMLRIIIGGLWSMCGSWKDARISFKNALNLDPSLTYLNSLIEFDSPPENLFIILGGVGRVPKWDPSIKANLIRDIRFVTFKPQVNKSKIYLKDKSGAKIDLNISPDSKNWYNRHFERDNVIHEMIEDSKYGGEVILEAGTDTAKAASGIAVGTTVTLLGGSAGLYLSYYGIFVLESAELGALGGIVTWLSFLKGKRIITRTTGDSLDDFVENTDPSEKYRFVRFLPEYAWIGWNEEKAGRSIQLFEQNTDKKLGLITNNQTRNKVYFTQISDLDEKNTDKTITKTSLDYLKEWENLFFNALGKKDVNNNSNLSKIQKF